MSRTATESLFLDGPVGRLEALLDRPDAEGPPQAVAVVLHPHPQHQGSMQNKVVHMLARSFTDLGIPALRFNFRGVGKSEGEYDNAVGEVDDALAALDWVHERWPEAELWLGGFSFGAQVAMRAANRRPVKHLVTVAPPVYRFIDNPPEPPRCDWLLIQGEADEVVDAGQVLDYARSLEQPPHIETLPETGHFFHGRLNRLRDIVTRYLGKA